MWKVWKIAIGVLTLTLLAFTVMGFAWTAAHDEASKMAALLSPAPFKDHPDWCAFGVYPDALNDARIAQHTPNDRWAVWLLVREAVRALREGDKARGCFLASVASHFPQDALCMSHSPVLKAGSGFDPAVLPEPLRALAEKLPVEPKTLEIRRYGRSNMQLVKNLGFFVGVEPPTLMRPLFEGVQGYVHDWLEDTAAALALSPERRRYIVGADTLSDHAGWEWQAISQISNAAFNGTLLHSLSNYYQRYNGIAGESAYHRWLTARYQGQWLLPFALFEGQSLREGRPKFRDREGLKAVFAEEFRLALEATACLYRYVAVAARTQTQLDWGAFAHEDAKLDAMAKDGVAILVGDARWLKVALFLRQELLFGMARQGVQETVHLITNGRDISDALAGKRWTKCHLIVMERGDGSGYRLRVGPREGVSGRLTVRLQVPATDELEGMGNLVDLLLDEAGAPLWGASPPAQVLDALRQVWAGAKLMDELRTRRPSPEDLVALAKQRPAPFRNTDEDKRRFAELVKSTRPTPGYGGWLRWLAEQSQLARR